MDGLRNILNCLQDISTIDKVPVAVRINVNAEVIENNSKTKTDAVDIYLNIEYGEYIACVVWAEDVGDLSIWHLGVVDKYDDNELHVSYMKKTYKKGKNWLFCEELEIRLTQLGQIIVRNIPVKYSLKAMVKCTLGNETHSNIQEFFLKQVA